MNPTHGRPLFAAGWPAEVHDADLGSPEVASIVIDPDDGCVRVVAANRETHVVLVFDGTHCDRLARFFAAAAEEYRRQQREVERRKAGGAS
jgi:hypothetical protein